MSWYRCGEMIKISGEWPRGNSFLELEKEQLSPESRVSDISPYRIMRTHLRRCRKQHNDKWSLRGGDVTMLI